MKDYYQIIYKLDDSKFKQIRKGVLMYHEIPKVLQVLNDNLWSMFTMKYTKEEMVKLNEKGQQPFGMCVSEYAWTPEVEKQFYNHKYNSYFIKQLDRISPLSLGMFKLNSEPATYYG